MDNYERTLAMVALTIILIASHIANYHAGEIHEAFIKKYHEVSCDDVAKNN